ncbi:Holliday junction resolvase RuvX [Flavobacterium agricola]|uniref:Putative pre-16S rRNA nuclease n=1 Tax=Flavobacterium agricola TaxID=2870839 RepID=A0ABY6LY75_9FLAO|nr:Holliday junction resolvase RuvX [Flavobacterium agricola]UYW00339.1 Holliday junction resolvase RuvX [Flavobacterium agricola]
MSRILAIDYGLKRTGIAITDPLQIIASGLETVDTVHIFVYLQKLLSDEDIQTVVVGEPKQLNGEASQSAPLIEAFLQKFKTKFPHIEVVRIDERFTSKIAFKTMIDSGLKKKQRQNKALIDEIAATIMLQDYLAQK